MSISKGGCVSAEELVSLSDTAVVTKRNAPLEETWRQDAAALRAKIAGAQTAIANLEAVTTNASKSASDRRIAERALVPARQTLASFERQWTKFAAQAVVDRIPRAWIEPSPTLSTQQ